MAKIVRFKSKSEASNEGLVELLKEITQKAEAGELVNFIFAAKLTDGNIATSWSNCDVGEHQELIAHSQVDINYRVVQANIDQLIEFV